MTTIQKRLFQLQDVDYKEFHGKLMPGIDPETIIGIPVPVLRKEAKKLEQEVEITEFMASLPHKYYEENNLHMIWIAQIKDYDNCIKELKKILPYVNNWATCDFAIPTCFQKHKQELLPEINAFIRSKDTYTIRYGVGLLMRLFLDGDFLPEYPKLVASVESEEYYVNMMIAWYFATALAKQWESIVPYIENRELSPWIHKKTIQKAVESRRITEEQKTYLKSFR